MHGIIAVGEIVLLDVASLGILPFDGPVPEACRIVQRPGGELVRCLHPCLCKISHLGYDSTRVCGHPAGRDTSALGALHIAAPRALAAGRQVELVFHVAACLLVALVAMCEVFPLLSFVAFAELEVWGVDMVHRAAYARGLGWVERSYYGAGSASIPFRPSTIAIIPPICYIF